MHTNSVVEKRKPKAARDAQWQKRVQEALWRGEAKDLAALKPAVKANSKIPSSATPLEKSSGHDNSALIEAVCAQNVGAVRWLLEQSLREKIDIAKIVSAPGKETALIKAASLGNHKMVSMLLPFSDLAAVDNDGHDALMQAAAFCEAETVLELLPLSDAKRKAKLGSTALMQAAARMKEPKALRALLAASDPLEQNVHGNTALMWAARCGLVESVEILLPYSNPKHRNSRGETAFDCAFTSAEEVRRNWAVCDLLADFAPRKKAARAFKAAGPQGMPRWAARIEAEALKTLVADSGTTPEGQNLRKERAMAAKRM